jgi:acyl-CoA synthetase (AMP-forming)/AMP-acid ligase II
MKSQLYNLGDILQAHDGNSNVVEIDPVNLDQRSITTQQLELTAQALSRYLYNEGYRPYDRVAILSDNCLESIACYLSILKLGGIVVMISSKATASQISSMLQDSAVKLVFTDRVLDTNLPVFDLVQVLEKFSNSVMFESYCPSDDDTAIILLTSGSTGNPQRVEITHRARISMLSNNRPHGTTKSLFANPLYHSMGMNSLDMNLYNKNDLFFLRKFEPCAYLKVIDHLRPTNLIGVPSMFSLLTLQQDLIETLNLSSALNIVLSGGATTPTLYKQLTQIFKNATIHIAYGSTELGPGIFGPHKTLPKPPTSVGCEQEGILYRIVDTVLQVKSPQMMKGYDGKTCNFTPDGYYITNDQFEVDQDGFYYFVGRSDDMFKSGGNKIFPSEIERVVEQHTSVDKCVALPIKDSVKEFKPYAFVTLTPGSSTTAQEIIMFLKDKLAKYQLPRQVWVIDKFPLSAVNKIDKQKLKVLAEQNLNI